MRWITPQMKLMSNANETPPDGQLLLVKSCRLRSCLRQRVGDICGRSCRQPTFFRLQLSSETPATLEPRSKKANAQPDSASLETL